MVQTSSSSPADWWWVELLSYADDVKILQARVDLLNEVARQLTAVKLTYDLDDSMK